MDLGLVEESAGTCELHMQLTDWGCIALLLHVGAIHFFPKCVFRAKLLLLSIAMRCKNAHIKWMTIMCFNKFVTPCP